jgi:hypothetical protein
MYDSSPLSTATSYILLATARRLVEAGKTTDWKGNFQDPASCVAFCYKKLAQQVCTNLQLENLYEHWQTLFPNCTRCLVQQHRHKGTSRDKSLLFYGALARSQAMTVPVLGFRDNGFFKRWGHQPRSQNHLFYPALFTSFSGCVIQTSKIYKYFMAFRKYGMFLVSFTRTQLLRGTAECMYPLRNPATSAVSNKTAKRKIRSSITATFKSVYCPHVKRCNAIYTRNCMSSYSASINLQ